MRAGIGKRRGGGNRPLVPQPLSSLSFLPTGRVSFRRRVGDRGRGRRAPIDPAQEADVSVQLAVRETKPISWTRRHLLGLEDLSRAEIETILDAAEGFVETARRKRKKRNDLKGKVVVNLFFEPSTADVRASFAFAAKAWLSADTHDFTPERPAPASARKGAGAFNRYGQEHRGDGHGRDGGAPFHAGGAALAGAAPPMQRHQRGGRGP